MSLTFESTQKSIQTSLTYLELSLDAAGMLPGISVLSGEFRMGLGGIETIAGIAIATISLGCWAFSDENSSLYLMRAKSGREYVLHGLTNVGRGLFEHETGFIKIFTPINPVTFLANSILLTSSMIIKIPLFIANLSRLNYSSSSYQPYSMNSICCDDNQTFERKNNSPKLRSAQTSTEKGLSTVEKNVLNISGLLPFASTVSGGLRIVLGIAEIASGIALSFIFYNAWRFNDTDNDYEKLWTSSMAYPLHGIANISKGTVEVITDVPALAVAGTPLWAIIPLKMVLLILMKDFRYEYQNVKK